MWMRSTIVLSLAVARASADVPVVVDSTIRLPVVVDSGSGEDFVLEANANVQKQAELFCANRGAGPSCTEALIAQVAAVMQVRQTAQAALPSLNVTLRGPKGRPIQFEHEEGANPAEEARAFCKAHHPAADLDHCVEDVLRTAEAALIDRQQKAEMAQKEAEAWEIWRSVDHISFEVPGPQGDMVRFTHEKGAHPFEEAHAFCAEHFPKENADHCRKDVLRAAEITLARQKDAQAWDSWRAMLPHTFEVPDPQGQMVRFTHENGAHPIEEARAFCAKHFPKENVEHCQKDVLRAAEITLARPKEEL